MSPSPVNHETSRLLALPRELRDNIWDLTVANRSIHITEKGTVKKHESLLVTCRQTREETINIYYSTATFYCPGPEACLAWLSKIPTEHQALIKEIRVTLDGPGGMRRNKKGRLMNNTDELRLLMLRDLRTDMWLEDMAVAEGVLRDGTKLHLRV